MNVIHLTITYQTVFANSKWIRQYLWFVVWTLRLKILATDMTDHWPSTMPYNGVDKIRHLCMKEGNRHTCMWKIWPINVPVWVWLRLRGRYECDRLSQWNVCSATTSTRHNSEQLLHVFFKEYRPIQKLRMMMTIIDFILPGYQASLATATWRQTS